MRRSQIAGLGVLAGAAGAAFGGLPVVAVDGGVFAMLAGSATGAMAAMAVGWSMLPRPWMTIQHDR